MASLYEHAGSHRVQFTIAGKRRTLRLGKLNAKTCRKVLAMMDQIEDELSLTGRLSVESLAWVNGQTLQLRQRLASCGVIPVQQQCVRLTVLLCKYEAGMNVKESTMESYGHTIRNLRDCYGGDTPSDLVTDGAIFERYLKEQGLARATIGRRIKAARTIWTWAIENDYASTNPFTKISAPAQVNDARKVYVDPSIIQSIIDLDTDPEFRLILAMARFAGLRCPSEIAPMKWADIDWNAGTMLIHSPKTEHHEGGGSRLIPVFSRVLPHLRAVCDESIPGTEFVLQRLGRSRGQAWTNKLRKRLTRLGISRWPRLWQNLRASAATDLAGKFRMPVVSDWMGHGIAVSQTHYQMVTRADFEAARGVVQNRTHDGGAIAWSNPEKHGYSPYKAGILGREGLAPRTPADRERSHGAIRDAQLHAQYLLAQAYRRMMARAAARARA